MTVSPTQLTLRELRKSWPFVQVVEHWVPGANVRRDLFNFIDVLAVGVLAVQATSDNGGNVSKRCKKIADNPALPHLREAGWLIEVWGWRKVGTRWQSRRVDLS